MDTVGKNAKKIEEYIKHQSDEDKAGQQLTMGISKPVHGLQVVELSRLADRTCTT